MFGGNLYHTSWMDKHGSSHRSLRCSCDCKINKPHTNTQTKQSETKETRRRNKRRQLVIVLSKGREGGKFGVILIIIQAGTPPRNAGSKSEGGQDQCILGTTHLIESSKALDTCCCSYCFGAFIFTLGYLLIDHVNSFRGTQNYASR